MKKQGNKRDFQVKINLLIELPNSPGNSCCASKTKRSVHQRSCDDAVEPGGEAVPDVEFCESSMTLFDLLFNVIFEFQSDWGGELGR